MITGSLHDHRIITRSRDHYEVSLSEAQWPYGREGAGCCQMPFENIKDLFLEFSNFTHH